MTDFEKWLEMNYSNMKRMQMSTLSEGLLNKAGFSVQSQSEKAKDLAEFVYYLYYIPENIELKPKVLEERALRWLENKEKAGK